MWCIMHSIVPSKRQRPCPKASSVVCSEGTDTWGLFTIAGSPSGRTYPGRAKVQHAVHVLTAATTEGDPMQGQVRAQVCKVTGHNFNDVRFQYGITATRAKTKVGLRQRKPRCY